MQNVGGCDAAGKRPSTPAHKTNGRRRFAPDVECSSFSQSLVKPILRCVNQFVCGEETGYAHHGKFALRFYRSWPVRP